MQEPTFFEVPLSKKAVFTIRTSRPQNNSKIHYSLIDTFFNCPSYRLDYGPFTLCHVYYFNKMVNHTLVSEKLGGRKAYFYCSQQPKKLLNAIFLCAAYFVTEKRKTPEEALKPFESLLKNLPPFRDAGQINDTFGITVEDCIQGLYKALTVGLFDFHIFNSDEYQFFSMPKNGGMNWIHYRKILALQTPDDNIGGKPGEKSKDNIDSRKCLFLFKSWNIKTVIRLCDLQYNDKLFKDNGIKVHDLIFSDGSTPPDGFLAKFIKYCEKEKGPIAVHCEAGLGRTGTLIGAYLMKHYFFTAREVIGYLRICRPGSVIGQQQYYLAEKEKELHASGRKFYNIRDPEQNYDLNNNYYTETKLDEQINQENYPINSNTNQIKSNNNYFNDQNNYYNETDNQYYDSNNEYYDPNNEYYDPNNEYYDPNNGYYDPNNDNYDPNNDNYDPNNDNYDPNNDNYDPNNDNYDPNNDNYDPNNDNYDSNNDNYDSNNDNYDSNNGYYNDPNYDPNNEYYNDPNSQYYDPNNEYYDPNDPNNQYYEAAGQDLQQNNE